LTKDLYTAKEIAEVKKQLHKEQNSKCALSGVVVDLKDCHTDHAHDDQQLVRGVLHKQSNMCLGRLEGLWTRFLKHWYPQDLPTFLRQSADYLDRPIDTRWRHSGWIKKIQTKFNTLKEKQKDDVLTKLGYDKQPNGLARKNMFKKAILSRQFGYPELKLIIEKQKE
jgi:hypothetical protein